jgi:hypothetical protein
MSVELAIRGESRTRWFAPALIVFTAAIYPVFFRLPLYTTPRLLGVTRPAPILVPPLWLLVCWMCRRLLQQDQVIRMEGQMGAVQCLAHLYMLHPTWLRAPLLNDTGSPFAVCVVATHITERKVVVSHIGSDLPLAFACACLYDSGTQRLTSGSWLRLAARRRANSASTWRLPPARHSSMARWRQRTTTCVRPRKQRCSMRA